MKIHPLITTTPALADLCERLSKADFITVDTEFMRENTYWPELCLVQIADDKEAAAIDPLAPGLDLAPLLELLVDNEDVLKVFHAGGQDVEIIYNLTGRTPHPIFDTQIAMMAISQSEQIGYSNLVESWLGFTVDKGARFTDWSRRPLSEAQISYALADVTYLRDIYRALTAKLEKAGRSDWLGDEMTPLISPATYEQHPENAWERFRHRARKPRDLAVLMDVCAWREREAQTRDVPRSRILKDDVMIEVALAAPRTPEALANLRSFPRGMERSRSGAEILAAIEHGLARDPKSLPRIERDRRPGGGAGATVELLKVLLRQVSEKHGVAAKMIATVDDLEAIASDDSADVAAMRGWRREIFGAKALELKRGKLALTVERGRVITLEWQDAPGEGAANGEDAPAAANDAQHAQFA